MANICDFSMKVVGEKAKIEKFVEWLKARYGYWKTPDGQLHVRCSSDRHFYRVDDVSVRIESENTAYISGYCAWSVLCSMIDAGPFSYYSKKDDSFASIRKHIDLIEASKILDLKIEIYSCECGMQFSEHLRIEKGEYIKNECAQYNEYDLSEYSSKQEAEKDLGFSISDEDWKEYEGAYLPVCEWFPWEFEI